jgi:hypothetical protein
MREEFNEAMQTEAQDPMDSRIIDFDYDASEGGEVPIRYLQIEAACDGLRTLADFQLGTDCDKHSKRAFEMIGRRVVAFWWGVNPLYFSGSPSLTSLAKRTGIDESGLSRISAEVTRAFGVHNRAQAHGDGVRGK